MCGVVMMNMTFELEMEDKGGVKKKWKVIVDGLGAVCYACFIFKGISEVTILFSI